MSLESELVDWVVNPIKSTITGVPRLVVQEFERTTTAFTGVAGTFKNAAGAIEEAAESADTFIRYLTAQEQKFDAAEFRNKLTVFNKGLVDLGEELPRHLPGGTKVTLPFAMEESFADDVIMKMPKVVLFPLGEALQALSGWEGIPDQLLNALRQLPGAPHETMISSREPTLSLSASATTDSSSGDEMIVVLRTLAQLLVQTLKYARSVLPRDTSVTAEVVGEGGGTEVCANPAGILIDTAAWLIGLVDTVLGMYQSLSKRG